MENKLNRNEFLKSLGFKGASLVALYCTGNALSSCSSDNIVVPSSVDLSVDLTTTTALANTGGYTIVSNVVIANTGNGNYVAASITCPHENKNAIKYQGSSFFCPEHNATFSTNGTCTNGVTGRKLTIYTVTKTGNILKIN